MADQERIDMLDSPKKEIVEFLEENGWNVMVAGASGVKQGYGKYNYEFVMEFSGKKDGKLDVEKELEEMNDD